MGHSRSLQIAPFDRVRTIRYYPSESEGICFHRRWFVCLSVCLSVTTITKTIVYGFVPIFGEGS